MTILITEMEYAFKMTLLNTQQSLVLFLEQLGAETNDLNSVFKKAIIKTVLIVVLSFFLFVYYFDYHAVSLSLSSFLVFFFCRSFGKRFISLTGAIVECVDLMNIKVS